MMPLWRFILAVFLLAHSPCLWAHGDIHNQIAACTRNIEQQTNNAELHLHRAELYRQHQEWSPALADCDRAGQLNPGLAVVNLLRGRIQYDAGRLEPARKALDIFLNMQPGHVEGLIVRARVLTKLKEFALAERDWTSAITHSESPEPDHFLERARVQFDQQKVDAAIAGLDEGIQKLGPIVSLELRAIELETAGKNFDAAVARVNVLAAQSARKESWLALRGEILERAGKNKEALADYESTLKVIAALPENRRQTPAVVALHEKATHAIHRLSPGASR